MHCTIHEFRHGTLVFEEGDRGGFRERVMGLQPP